MTDPRRPIVFDINVFIDVIDPHSRTQESAALALANDNDMKPYVSDLMLNTLAYKLIQRGVSEARIRNYLDLLTDEEQGLGFAIVKDLVVTDRGIRDRYGNADYEDAIVVTTLDKVRELTGETAVFVTNDRQLAEWCVQHHQATLQPRALPGWTRRPVDAGKSGLST